MQNTNVIVILLGMLLGSCLSPTTPQYPASQVHADDLPKSEAVSLSQKCDGWPELFFDQAGENIFPEAWRSEAINANALPLDPLQIAASKLIADKVLSLYPADVLKQNLKKVYFLGMLEFRGVKTGGTNSRNVVYIVNLPRVAMKDVEINWHAEFSSILLRNYADDFDAAAWDRCNPTEFVYRGNGVQAIRLKQANSRLSQLFHEQGFLHEYAMSDRENDFNSYAARLFVGDAKLWSAMETFPNVSAKAKLTISFLNKIHPAFDREYFLSLVDASR